MKLATIETNKGIATLRFSGRELIADIGNEIEVITEASNIQEACKIVEASYRLSCWNLAWLL